MSSVFVLCLLLALMDGNVFSTAGQKSRQKRAIGGFFATEGLLPHHVALQLNGKNYCSGSLITQTMVLTVAHCVLGIDPNNMKVLVGNYDLALDIGQTCDIFQFIIHPGYSIETTKHDIALVELTDPVKLSDTVKTIEMAPANARYVANTMATTSGFGDANAFGYSFSRLKYVNIPIWGPEYCVSVPHMTNDKICAGNPSGEEGSCEGDSGGPLTVDGKLVGIVSGGFGCGRVNRPTLYTYVPLYRAWIFENANV